MISPAAELVLNALERLEFGSLQWGLVDGSIDEADLEALIERFHVEDPSTVLDELLDAHLLFRVTRWPSGRGYRTRFAEGVRLIASLRQIFLGQAWQSAPELIADFRVDLAPRLFPRRNIMADEVIAAVTPLVTSPRGRRALEELAREGNRRFSQFQLAAAEAILGSKRGVMVSAGTGAGKTLGFYLPALTQVAALQQNDAAWTKVVAVYPRTELLKDQLTIAIGQIEALNQAIGGQPLRVGAFFGDTPNNTSAVERWAAAPGGRVCPYIRCPACTAETTWLNADRDVGRERLSCSVCGWKNSPGTVALTRDSMMRKPPDVVFATLEMVNRHLGTWRFRPLLGVANVPSRRARLVLLDEVHLYTGLSGAMYAGVLARWRQALGPQARLVGLSATVQEPVRLFGQLTGLRSDEIELVAPADEDLERRGAAYQLLLRTNPLERLSVLSATIQTAFLMARLLDPVGRQGFSSGVAGNRVFVFTDDLDVTNRLYDDLRDAEGWRGRQAVKAPLASERRSGRAGDFARDRAGQLWRLSEALNFDLTQPLVVSRTSSQDPGVSAESSIVVASSSLEVGFDDPQVGVAIQHRAPRDLGSFLQRRGRAGRKPEQRPWMVSVLSDYGRDRQTYQSYELLFAPSLPEQRVPVANVSVRRMQAVYSLLDWLSTRCGEMNGLDSLWSINAHRDRQFIRNVMTTLRGVMTDDAAARTELREHLKSALRLTDEAVDEVLWAPPRSLMLEAIPTLQRRLAPIVDLTLGLPELPEWSHPLLEFAPSALFSDLNVPDVRLVRPGGAANESNVETMPIAQAMRETAPGRVSRRFAYDRAGVSYWIPVTLREPVQAIELSSFVAEREVQGVVEADIAGVRQTVPLVRPRAIRLATTPNSVRATSNSFLTWRTAIEPQGDGVVVDERLHRWRGLQIEPRLYLHSQRTPVTVRRYAISGAATLTTSNGEQQFIEYEFVDRSAPVALGFEQEVDALAFRFTLPSFDDGEAETVEDGRYWRSAYVRDRILMDTELPASLSRFAREWLYRVGVATLGYQVGVKRQEATTVLAAMRANAAAFDEVIAVVMGGRPGLRLEEDDDEQPATNRQTRAALDAVENLRTDSIRERLVVLLNNLVHPSTEMRAWRDDVLVETLAQAINQAIMTLGSRAISYDDVLVDVERADHAVTVWITEASPGGNGALEAVAAAFADEPRRLFRALDAALGESVAEYVSIGLDRIIELLQEDEELVQQFATLRTTDDHVELQTNQRQLRRELRARGIATSHELLVAVAHRMLRQGTGKPLDDLLCEIMRGWRVWEERLGAGIDHATCCALVALDDDLRQRVNDVMGAANAEERDVLAVIGGIIWPRAQEARSRALENYHPFRPTGRTDAAIVASVLPEASGRTVFVSDDGWRDVVRTGLELGEDVDLVATHDERSVLREAIQELVGTAYSVGYLRLYPTTERVMSDSTVLRTRLRLAESG